MRQGATGSTATPRARQAILPLGVLSAALALLAGLTWGGRAVQGAEPRPLYRVLTAQLPHPVKRVLALTCPGLAPADLVDYPQRPGTPEPSHAAPPLRTVLVLDEQGHASRVRLQGGALLLEPLETCQVPERRERPELIPGGGVSPGTGYIAEAWLAAPTLRYRHGALGTVLTAGELQAANRQGDILRLRLPDDAVFEDRWARVVVVNGQDAVLVVRTGLATGAALALYGLDRPAADAGALVQLAQSDPLGKPDLWLNPIGAGDFDGSGRTAIAAVLTPHQDGTLALYRREGAKLVERQRARGFSNHELYSAELGMAAVVDANGDGIPDLAVPDATRRALRIVTFAGGRFRELQRIPHDSEIVSAIVAQDLGGGHSSLVYALQDGTVVLAAR